MGDALNRGEVAALAVGHFSLSPPIPTPLTVNERPTAARFPGRRCKPFTPRPAVERVMLRDASDDNAS